MRERTDHNEAMRLADRIIPETDWYEFDQVTWCNEAAALLRQQAEQIDAELCNREVLDKMLTQCIAERDQLQSTATALIALLADIRKACGDNGKRMQPELVEFIGAMKADGDQLRAEVERLRADGERYVYLRDVHQSRVPHDSLIGLWVFSRPTATALAFDESIDAARTTHKETE